MPAYLRYQRGVYCLDFVNLLNSAAYDGMQDLERHFQEHFRDLLK